MMVSSAGGGAFSFLSAANADPAGINAGNAVRPDVLRKSLLLSDDMVNGLRLPSIVWSADPLKAPGFFLELAISSEILPANQQSPQGLLWVIDSIATRSR